MAMVDPSEVRAMRRLWAAVLCSTLEEMADEAAARRYLNSRDGRMVLELAEYDAVRAARLSLKPARDRCARRSLARTARTPDAA